MAQRDRRLIARADPFVLDHDLQLRAAMASDLPMVVADAQSEDYVLVWVNPAFERVTGYLAADVIGHNCRFLQGPNPDRDVTRRIRSALVTGRTADETMLNFRADGSEFWNHVVISPMRDHFGVVTHFVGVQADVTDRVESEAGRHTALRAAGRANDRLRTIASIDRQMDARLRVGENVLTDLPHILSGELPGWAVVAEVDQQSPPAIATVVAHHSDPRRAACAGELAAGVQAAAREPSSSPFGRVVRQLMQHFPIAVSLSAEEILQSDDVPAGAFREGLGAMLVGVPLLSRGRLVGALVLGRDGERSFDTDDIAAVADIAVRISMALDIGRLYAREHSAALTLQRSLLPRLPTVAGFEVAAEYQPAERGSEIGGDWYDVLDFAGPGVGIAIGDVMGHDLAAAAAMGQLRSVLRSYAWAGDAPAAVLARLDELVRGLGMAAIATCFYATVTPTGSVDHTLTYASAGHPPPLLRRADGRVECLDDSLTSPIGVRGRGPRPDEAHTTFGPGDVLVLYTDGLVESRVRDIGAGIADLVDALATAPPKTTAAELCASLMAGLRGRSAGEDDTCLLVLRCLPPVQ